MRTIGLLILLLFVLLLGHAVEATLGKLALAPLLVHAVNDTVASRKVV